MGDGWQVGLHDNTPLGWLITAGYLATVAMCIAAAKRVPDDERSARHTWLAVAIGLVFLGLNKQLDLQNLLRFEGRDLTLSLGLYEHKHVIRVVFLILLATLGLAAAIRWRRRFLSTLLGHPCLAAGLVLLAVFVILSGLHPAQLTGWEILPVTRPEWHWTLEAGALLLMAGSAVGAMESGSRRSPSAD